MFDKIKADCYIIDIYNKIEDPLFNERFWTYHGFNHVNGVIDMVESILLQFGCDNEYVEGGKIAALLHDIGMIEGKENHHMVGYELAKKYFDDNNIYLKYKDEILDAIRLHSDTMNCSSVMAVVLMFADKLDTKKTRLAPSGYNIVGLRQYQYIEDINVIISNDLTVQFIINDKCNKQELESWYFIPKVFDAIKTFANHFNLDYKILWNNQEWILRKSFN